MTEGEGVTIRPKVELLRLVPSLTVTVMGATPIWLAAGVRATVRLLPAPPKTILAFGRRVVLAELPERVRLAADVSASPTVKEIGAVAVLMRVLVAGMAEMIGGVLAGRTVTVKDVLLDFPPVSITQTVTLDEPACEAAVTLTVRLAPLPPNAILATGTTPGFDEAPLRVRLAAGSSASSTVKDSGPVDWFTRMVWSAMPVIVGGVSPPGMSVPEMVT